MLAVAVSAEKIPVVWRDRDLSTGDAIMHYRGRLHIDSIHGSNYLVDLPESPRVEEVLWSDDYEVEIRVIRRLAKRETVEIPANPDDSAEAKAFEAVRLRSLGAEDEILNEEGGCVSGVEFAKRLGIKSRQTIHNYREANKIFVLPEVVYPAWQIHNYELLPSLDLVLKRLDERHTDPFSIALFFLTPAEALDYRRPLDLLRRGEIDEVLLHVERYGDVGA